MEHFRLSIFHCAIVSSFILTNLVMVSVSLSIVNNTIKTVSDSYNLYSALYTKDVTTPDPREVTSHNGSLAIKPTANQEEMSNEALPNITEEIWNNYSKNCVEPEVINASKPLYIAALLPLSNHYLTKYTRVFLQVIERAFDEIRERNDILPDHNLQLIIKDTEGNSGFGLKRLFEVLSEEPKVVMLLGPPLSSVVEAVGQVVHYFNLVQVSFTARIALDKKRYPNTFTIPFIANAVNPVKIALMKYYGWERVATLSGKDDRHVFETSEFHGMLKEHNLTLLTSGILLEGASTHMQRLKQYEARIIFISVDGIDMADVLCEAYRYGMYGKGIAWIFSGYSYFSSYVSRYAPELSCSEEEIITASRGFILVDHKILRQDNVASISGKKAGDFEEWLDRENIGKFRAQTLGWVYDAAWVVALSLNHTQQQLPDSASLEDFNYSRQDIAETIKHSLYNLDFEGISGPVSFASDGNRVGVAHIEQSVDGDDASRVIVARYNPRSDRITWLPHRSLQWPGGSPPRDRFEHVSVYVTLPKSLVACLGILVAAGIVLALSFLVFNLVKRHHRLIKMSSPNINNLIVIGGIVSYTAIYFYSLGPDSEQLNACMARIWVTSLGFTVGFGAMFSKTWRVHELFKNEALKRKVVRDGKLLGLVLVFVIIDMIILLAWTIWQPLTWTYVTSRSLSDDRVYTYHYPECYHSQQNFWYAGLYIYKGLLLAFGVFLAWETRMISIPALNDSKYIGIAVYNVVVVCVVGVPVAHALNYEQNMMRFVLVSVLIMFCTTFTLCLVFVPKFHASKEAGQIGRIVMTTTSREFSGKSRMEPEGSRPGRSNASSHKLGVASNSVGVLTTKDGTTA